MKTLFNSKVIYFVTLTFLLITISCDDPEQRHSSKLINNPEYGSWQTMNETPVNFEILQTFGTEVEPQEATLSHISDVFTDDSLNVYILDHESNKLVSFLPNGKLRWSSGGEGRGPGDFENARTMAWDGENGIYVGNLYGMRVDKFDMQGNFVESLNVPGELEKSLHGNHIVGFNNDKLVVLSGIDAKFSATFSSIEVGDSLHLIDSHNIDLTGSVEVPVGMHQFSSPTMIDEHYIIPDVKNYSIHVYDKDFEKLTVVNRDVPWIVRPGFMDDGDNRMMGTFSEINDVLKFNSGYYLSSAYWVKGIDDPDKLLSDFVNGKIEGMDYKNTIDIFSEDWELLYSIEEDRNINSELGQPVHVDNEDNLYAYSFNPYPHLKKLKVSINE
jgi:hypothetical protein